MDKDNKNEELISSLTHDLRSQLSIVVLYSEMILAGGDLSEEKKGFLNEIITANNRMAQILTEFADNRK